jgi:GNAT superfamily N-acetyltransferase
VGGHKVVHIRVLSTDAEIAAAFPLMLVLRERLAAETFVEVVRQQQRDGYVLVGGYDGGTLVTLAGFRAGQTLSRGPHLFVDDLVTDPDEQGKGYGQAMISWLRQRAIQMKLPTVWLDSRATAKGFYERCGFTMNTSIPCWIAASQVSPA